ncbi:MAG: helix-turn-helix domain-containing protein [Muribaculaceae bacterium]|nr:helix-turn-helix domain-containing protein [Muribaculaceae bacterium]
MSIHQELSAYLEKKGISQVDIAEELGVTKSYVNQLLSGKKQFGKRQANIWSEKFGFSKSWLLTGEGSMLDDETDENYIWKNSKEDEAIKLGHPVAEIREEMVDVRFFYLTPTATFQEYCSSEDESVHHIKISRMPGDRLDESACVFEIRGDSMAPQIQPKARVLCHEISPTRWHQIRDCVVVIAYADRFVIKRVVSNKLDSENYLVLASDNPDYPGEEIVQYCDIRCIFCADRIISQPIY